MKKEILARRRWTGAAQRISPASECLDALSDTVEFGGVDRVARTLTDDGVTSATLSNSRVRALFVTQAPIGARSRADSCVVSGTMALRARPAMTSFGEIGRHVLCANDEEP